MECSALTTNQENIDCNGGPCEISRSDMESYEISWGADVSGDGWVSAGFGVSESEETGTTATCASKDGTIKVCIWWRTAHT